MSIITFWNDSREQTGKTLTAAAVATIMSIERNNKILLLSTSVADATMENCFWSKQNTKNKGFFNNKKIGIEVENGIEGLLKLATSKKLTSSIITDYTKVIFKDRLEVLPGPEGIKGRDLQGNIEDFRKNEQYYTELIKLASQYYDIVIVDLDKNINTNTKEEILKLSDVNSFVFSQKIESINRYSELREENKEIFQNKCIPVIGKYINNYKYNSKNISRYLKQKKEFDVLPFNLLYMEAAEEANIIDLLLRLRNIKDKTDDNYIFMECLQNLTNNITKKMQDMQMKLR